MGKKCKILPKHRGRNKVKITGRVQSRNYEKKLADGTTETRTAYEVSISSLEIVNEEEENKEVI